MTVRPSSNLSEERPSIDAVLAEMRALSTAIDHLDHATAERLNLNRTDLRCLDILSSRGPMTAKALAEALRMTTGGLTSVIDRLEQAGYIRRQAHPTDRRQLLIESTERTAATSAEVFGPLIAATRRLAAEHTDDQLRVISEFLRRWRTSITTVVLGEER